MEVMGFIFGLAGFSFAMNALARIVNLEKQLKETGILKSDINPPE